ncbi:MAG: 30S ribosomal protein S7 [Desulfurivibrio sp.]
MPRRRVVAKRPMTPDPRFNSVVVSKFINRIMLAGKKSTARGIFYDAMDLLETRVKEASPLEVFEGALDRVRPKLEVKSRRVGGATYQVPMEVRTERRNALAIRWLVAFARQRPGKTMAEKLAAELSDAFQNRGAAVKKKEDTHRMAEANKAFAHYRW